MVNCGAGFGGFTAGTSTLGSTFFDLGALATLISLTFGDALATTGLAGFTAFPFGATFTAFLGATFGATFLTACFLATTFLGAAFFLTAFLGFAGAAFFALAAGFAFATTFFAGFEAGFFFDLAIKIFLLRFGKRCAKIRGTP
jgi:hypothetical protein